ncbi:hypothetical protein [Leptolyngbya ohadii]|uniref:hypothetical protein n=1 Tax=Leptolyngbya ohadii TaxID=1962290 RepID=UPI000B59EF5C|nr:hypothetical protein [Leptolyngbya ohadii]
MPAGISESDFKIQSERILRQIRATKLEGLQADLDREKLITKRKQKSVEVAAEQLRQEEIKLSIEQTRTDILRNNLRKTEVERSISEVEITGAQDRLSFETQAVDLNRDLFRQRLEALDLTLGEATFHNDDRRSEYREKEIRVGLPRSFSFPGMSAANANLN